MSTRNAPEIVLGVTGSIAAYKAAELVRLMIKAGWGVNVVMTKGAAIEATGLLTVTFPEYFRSRGGADYQQRAEDLFYQILSVPKYQGVQQD